MRSALPSLLVLALAWVGCSPWPLTPQPTGSTGPADPGTSTIGTIGANGSTGGTFATSGTVGSTGTTGAAGTTGTSGAAPCDTLGEAACLARADCEPVYGLDSSGTTVFEGCESQIVCPEIACAVGCQMMNGPPGGCPVCQCSPVVCTSNSDCPSGEYCDFAVDGGVTADPPGTSPPAAAGQCEQVQVCPAIACPVDDPNQLCTTGTDANGCPTCECQPMCESDQQCGPGLVCRQEPCASLGCSGRCIAASCQSNSDCQAGEVCVNDCACNGPGDCPDCITNLGTCEAAPPQTCTTDANCPVGDTCQPGPISPCPPGEDCNTVAVSYECLPAPTCTTNADCQPGEICGPNPDGCGGPAQSCAIMATNICQPPPGNCGPYACASGEVCEHLEGGALNPADGGFPNSYSCIAYPQQCSTVAGCDCVGEALCGSASSADCSGTVPVVTCYVP